MVDHKRYHKVPSQVKAPELAQNGLGAHTQEIMDGMQKIKAIAALVESVIVWRAQYIAWNVDIYKAEPLLFRLIFKEGSENPNAMDLLARIYFQQSKYEKAKELWTRASELQPGNPALRKTAFMMQNIAKSPSSALFRHRLGVMFKGTCMAVLLCLVGWGGMMGVNAAQRWAEGPIAVQNLTGRFHYEYDSITKNMVYVPGETALGSTDDEVFPSTPSGEDDGTYNVGFTRRKISSGKELGRIEVVVERRGNSVKASGKIPNLYVRYLVEQALWEVPGVSDVDLRNLEVDRTYRVSRGDSLWLIAKRLYGEGTAWTVLAKYNNLSEPGKLRIGQELALPLGDEKLELEY